MVLKKLESVANMIDEDGVTYPMLADGGYDVFCGVHVSDIENEEWFNALSKEDLAVVEEHNKSSDDDGDEVVMKYISIEIGGISHEWSDFQEMINYYKNFPSDSWKWTKAKDIKVER